MKRDEFFRTVCTMGFCSFASMGFLAEGAEQSTNPELDELKWKLDFVRKRFAKLVGILNANLDENTRDKVFESLGRECARMFLDITGPYKGKPKEFLEEIKKRWAKETSYDEDTGSIRVVDKSNRCTCALVDEKLTPPAFCNCTLGWQKETYSMILGQPVEAVLEESVLSGGKRCVFRIQPTNTQA
jgi:predicted hydrocarbon binding protein